MIFLAKPVLLSSESVSRSIHYHERGKTRAGVYNQRVAEHGTPVVAALGDIVLDVLARAGGPLQHGTDVRGCVMLSPGGSAANFAVWIARLGVQSRLLGAVGADLSGDLLLADLRADGVGTEGVVRIPGRSSAVLALVDGQGERTMLTDRQSTLQLGAHHLAPEALEGVDHLHLTAYSFFDPGPESAAWRALDLARQGGATVSLDLSSSGLLRAHGPQRMRKMVHALAPDVLFGNEDEYQALLDGSAAGAARELARVVVLKQGARGCALLSGSAEVAVPTEPVTAVDTTGAGDAFDAAWVRTWLMGKGEHAACVEGNGLARKVVGFAGARASIDQEIIEE